MVIIDTPLGLKRYLKQLRDMGWKAEEEAGSFHMGRGIWAFRVKVEPPGVV